MKPLGENKIDILKFGLAIMFLSAMTLFALSFPDQENPVIKALRIVFGSVYILFLPGFCLTHAFFRKGEIDGLERFALSFALSISVVPLLVFYTNLIGLRITALNVFLIAFLVMIGCGAYLIYFKKDTPGATPPSDKAS